jgi:uncharacterized membrane protein YphA (DoxX/SURF4 family)
VKSSSSRNAIAIALLRISVGTLFLIFCTFKITSAKFTLGGGFQVWINRFLQDGAYPFMLPILRNIVLPHSTLLAFFVTASELAISFSLLSGIWTRYASAGGAVFMLTLLFAADYPGPSAPFWLYWGAALPHLGLFLCFATFLIGDSEQRFSLQGLRIGGSEGSRVVSGTPNA